MVLCFRIHMSLTALRRERSASGPLEVQFVDFLKILQWTITVCIPSLESFTGMAPVAGTVGVCPICATDDVLVLLARGQI